jgi:hypothetical protein
MTFLVALLLHASPLPDETQPPRPRALDDEISVGVGFLGNSYQVTGARLGDGQFTPAIFARKQLSFFTIEASVLLSVPFEKQTVGLSALGLARIGYAGEHFFIQAGAVAQWAESALPAFQILPTLKTGYLGDTYGLTLGLFDYYGLLPAHVTFDVKKQNTTFSIGYAAPLGMTLGFKTRVTPAVGISVNAFAYKLAQAEFAFIMLQGFWGEPK